MFPLPSFALPGPTASGKSAAALALVQTYRLPLEIVSVDSAQIYRGMEVGSAKPSAAERAAVPHHLLDLLDPTEPYSAARFCDDARAAIQAIHARGNYPLLVGGTMLYFQALLDGLHPLPESNPALRAELRTQAAAEGWPALHARLQALDPPTAARLAPRDGQRIERALEIVLVSGKPLSHWQSIPKPAGLASCCHTMLWIPEDRTQLHQRIAERFRAMLDTGLIDEVRALRAQYQARGTPLAAGLPAMRCVGYRQAWRYLAGDYGEGDAAWHTLQQRGIEATRQLAKRQMTWLRAMHARQASPTGNMPQAEWQTSGPAHGVLESFAADSPRRLAQWIARRIEKDAC